MRSFFLFATLLSAALGTACSKSDSTPATTDAGLNGTGGAAGEVLPDGGCPDPSKTPYGTECLEPAVATTRCQAESAKNSPGSKTDDVTCGAGCTCTYCASEMQACGTDPDCIKILLCAQEHNCTGAGCYLPPAGSPPGTKGPCQEIIDRSGGDAGLGSYGVALVQFVNGCATKTAAGTGRDYVNREGPTCPAACP